LGASETPTLKASEIKADLKQIEISGKISSIGDRREVQTRFGPAALAIAVLEDETGSIRLNLWRGQIDMVKVGDKVVVTNAFSKSFGGQIELNIGHDGSIRVVSNVK
jgi:replication factor A1